MRAWAARVKVGGAHRQVSDLLADRGPSPTLDALVVVQDAPAQLPCRGVPRAREKRRRGARGRGREQARFHRQQLLLDPSQERKEELLRAANIL